MSRILVVEDNTELAAGIRYNLELEGYDVRVAEDGRVAIEQVRAFCPELVILDLMLPEVDGFQVLRTLRDEGVQVPVLVLTARGEETDKVRAFRLDADQFVTKPFGLLELLERVKGLLRRAGTRGGATTPAAANGVIRFGDVEVDPSARKVRKAGHEVGLTPRAFDLLMALVNARDRVVSRHDLLRDVWGHRGRVLTRTVDSHISELRHKLEDDPDDPRHIHTVWKIGYRFEA